MYERKVADIVLIKNGLVYNSDTLEFEKKNIIIENGVIKAFTFEEREDVAVDVEGKLILPALVDVHTHGRYGFDFISCSEEELHIMAKSYAQSGVASVMPTLASASFDDMLAAVDRINRFEPKEDEARFVGVHIEGRYLNPKKKGAHAESLLKPLAASELEAEQFKGCRALHISAAFELDDGSFAAKAKEIGATLGLGHTNADYAEAKRAESMGITSYTHLFNCMPPLHHRDGGAVSAALTSDAYTELICDGIHISPEMVKLAYTCKGAKRLSLITDSMEATGCADGEYSIAGNKVIVKNGVALTESGALAGSTLNMFDAVINLMRFCGISFEEAVLSATATPARQMGVYDSCGSIDIGKSADLLVVDSFDRSVIDKVIVRGISVKLGGRYAK